jgi:radical SAM superfamily enzyme YgiQ (UPF0313 family)
MTSETRILLINPPYHIFFNRGATFTSLGLLYIAAVLRENGFEVKVYDANLRKGDPLLVRKKINPRELLAIYRKNLPNPNFYIWEKIRRLIRKFSPNVIGISIVTCAYNSALNVAKIAKEIDKDIIILVGGPHPTALPTEVLKEPYFDIVVRGEGEYTTLKLLKSNLNPKKVKGLTFKTKNKIIHNPPAGQIKNLDYLPFPARDLLINRKDAPSIIMGEIMGSRGCPFGCYFCGSRMMWGTHVRFRSPKNVVSEIEQIHKIYGIKNFVFTDDTFTLNKKWVIQLCKLIRDRKLDITWLCNTRLDVIDREILREMKLAGCDKIAVGVESGNQKILDAMGRNITLNKMRAGVRKIKEAGFILHATSMIGYPGETLKTIEDTEKFIKEINPDTFFVYIATPYPGTKLYDLAERRNLLLHKNWSEYTSFNPILKLNTISNKLLMNHYYRLLNYQHEKWKEFYRKRVLNLRCALESIKAKCFMADLKEFVRMNIL